MSSNLSFSLYYPLLVLGAAFAVLTVAGRVVEGRRGREAAANLQTLGFGAMLVAGAWTVALLVMSLIRYPVRMSDLGVIFATIFIFFAILLGLLFLLTEVRVGGRPIGAYLGAVLALVLGVFIVLAIV
jgi:hypothetical protein